MSNLSNSFISLFKEKKRGKEYSFSQKKKKIMYSIKKFRNLKNHMNSNMPTNNATKKIKKESQNTRKNLVNIPR